MDQSDRIPRREPDPGRIQYILRHARPDSVESSLSDGGARGRGDLPHRRRGPGQAAGTGDRRTAES